ALDGTGGVTIMADVNGDITGNVSGSVGSVTGSVSWVVGNVGGDVAGSVGSLAAQAKADVNAEVDSALNTAIPGSPTANSINERVKAIDDKLPSGTISDVTTAQVNAEVVDALSVDTIPELTAAAPAATPTVYGALMLLYMATRNEHTTTSSQWTIKNDAGTAIAKATISENATTTTKGELGAP
ncbi:MAG: hypothetical protein HY548_09975, partial [Elusimicrobia bacterium]|nr:hypothetical protein [Elusimicrobiota bacterium]